MKSFIRFALMLAGSAAIPASLTAQPSGGVAGAPPAPAAFSTNGQEFPSNSVDSSFFPPAPFAISTNGLGARIQFNTENHDAGTNLAGDPIRYTFLVTNTGDEMLVLSNVHAGCGCTIVGGTTPAALTPEGGTVPAATTTWTHQIAPVKLALSRFRSSPAAFGDRLTRTSP